MALPLLFVRAQQRSRGLDPWAASWLWRFWRERRRKLTRSALGSSGDSERIVVGALGRVDVIEPLVTLNPVRNPRRNLPPAVARTSRPPPPQGDDGRLFVKKRTR